MDNTSVKYKSISLTKTDDNTSYNMTFQGSLEEMHQKMYDYRIGTLFRDKQFEYDYRVKHIRVYQEEGSLWCCEIQGIANQHGSSTTPPKTDYGTKSATLECGVLSMPLESHPDYRTNWNHYLAGKGVSNLPSWFASATNVAVPDSRYRWVSSPSEVPDENWRILAAPKKLGYTSYELSTYVIRETVRCRTSSAAGKICANKMNKIGKPDNDFGITGGNWKCDGVSVRWNGKYWLATLTYTRSGDNNGWDKDLYSEVN